MRIRVNLIKLPLPNPLILQRSCIKLYKINEVGFVYDQNNAALNFFVCFLTSVAEPEQPEQGHFGRSRFEGPPQA